jgi:hypothetical protein
LLGWALLGDLDAEPPAVSDDPAQSAGPRVGQ